MRARGATHCVRPQLGEMWIKALERGEGAPRDVRPGPHRAKVNLLCFETLFVRDRNATTHKVDLARGAIVPGERDRR